MGERSFLSLSLAFSASPLLGIPCFTSSLPFLLRNLRQKPRNFKAIAISNSVGVDRERKGSGVYLLITVAELERVVASSWPSLLESSTVGNRKLGKKILHLSWYILKNEKIYIINWANSNDSRILYLLNEIWIVEIRERYTHDKNKSGMMETSSRRKVKRGKEGKKLRHSSNPPRDLSSIDRYRYLIHPFRGLMDIQCRWRTRIEPIVGPQFTFFPTRQA